MKGNFYLSDWEVQPEINCLKRADRSFHVEPKIMQVLVELASHSNEVLSKERLLHAVWPDTFVGDDVLTRCISEIRRVLEDDPRAPRYIQTIPKAGYRLIAPIEFEPETAAGPAAVEPPAQAAATLPVLPAPPEAPTLPEEKAPATAGRRKTVWLAAALALGLIVAGWVVWHWPRPKTHAGLDNSFRILPFTSYPGVQAQPAFSPDGNQVAFVWNGEQGDNRDIYVKMLGTEMPLRLTLDPADDFSPAWSPDGRSIAFMRSSEPDRGIYLISALGGAARKIFTPVGKIEWDRGTLSWSPDGKRLIFPDGKSSRSPSAIYSLTLATGEARPISAPPSFWDGDSSPVFSPDGSKIAFVRGIEGWVRDIYVMDAGGGSPTRLTSDNRFVSSLAWTADSSTIVFSSNRAGEYSLWKIPAKGGTPERLPFGGGDAFSPAIARTGNHLAYTEVSSTWSTLRIDLKSPRATARRLWSSTRQDSAPQFSPDGTRIAFQSWRSGTQEIWVASSDGANPVRVTSFERSLTGSPAWSPDGRQLAFDARPDQRSHIYSIHLDGGAPYALTSGDYNDIVPRWSHDGHWIYFGSNRSGDWQIWKVASGGGRPEQVTHQGGFVGEESPDGQWIYFAKADASGLWRIPVAGGDEQKIVDQPRIGYWGYWSLAKDGIYYLDQSAASVSIEHAGLTGEPRRRVLTLERTPPPFAGITVAPDERSLLYSDQVEAGSHITLVENFR